MQCFLVAQRLHLIYCLSMIIPILVNLLENYNKLPPQIYIINTTLCNRGFKVCITVGWNILNVFEVWTSDQGNDKANVYISVAQLRWFAFIFQLNC